MRDLGIKPIVLRYDLNDLARIEVVQGDTASRGFSVLIVGMDGQVLPASPAYECRLYGVNSNYPDRTYYTTGAIDGDRYKVYLSTDMVSKAGTLKLQIALYEGTTALIQSEITEVMVTESLASGGEAGTDLVVDFTQLTLAIERVGELEAAYTTSLAEQGTLHVDVVTKHGQVQTMHGSLQTVFDSEQERIAAETARVSDESARKTAETARATEEGKRKTAETARADAEDRRAEDEDTRVANEVVRQSNESTRVSAENARKTAETTRQTEEGKRKTAESARVSAENTRQTNESGRVSNETARIQQWQSWESLIEDGAMPNATSTTAGAVRVEALGTETAPHTVPTAGKVTSALSNKVDKETGKGLSEEDYTTAAKEKVDAIPASPKYTDTVTTVNGKTGVIAKADITALGIPAQDTVYTHPSTHPASMITQDSSRRMVSDAQITAWSGKVDSAGGQMTGALVGHANTQYNTAQMRNVVYLPVGTAPPTLPNGTLVLYYE